QLRDELMTKLAIIVWITLVGSVLAATCGDLNGSGGADPGDATLLVQRIFGGPDAADCGGLGTLQCGDVNRNRSLTVADLTVLLNLVAGNAVIFNCTSPGVPESNATLSGTIDTNRTLSGAPGSNVHRVTGEVLVSPGVVLTIQPGAIVEGVRANYPA